VIVGVGYPSDQARRRQFDLTMSVPRSTLPSNRFDPPYGPIGGADNFLDFLTGQLRRTIAAKVAVDQHSQALFGHSLGALFVLHTLFTRPDAFQTYVAASPSIWWGDRTILSEMQDYLRQTARQPSARRLLLTVGGLEQQVQAEEDALAAHSGRPEDAAALIALNRCYIAKFQEVDSVRYLANRLITASPKSLATSFVEFPGEVHMSVIPSYLSRGLRFFLAIPSAEGDQIGPPAPDVLQPMDLAACAKSHEPVR
jgi:predicted alpha/beta superfamily hydrolase